MTAALDIPPISPKYLLFLDRGYDILLTYVRATPSSYPLLISTYAPLPSLPTQTTHTLSLLQ